MPWICSESGSCSPIQTNPSCRFRTSLIASEWVQRPGRRSPATYTAQSTTYADSGTGIGRTGAAALLPRPRRPPSEGMAGMGSPGGVRGRSRRLTRGGNASARRHTSVPGGEKAYQEMSRPAGEVGTLGLLGSGLSPLLIEFLTSFGPGATVVGLALTRELPMVEGTPHYGCVSYQPHA